MFNSIPPISSKGWGRGIRLLFPIQSTPDDSKLQGKSKKVRVVGSPKKIAGSRKKNKLLAYSENFNHIYL